MDREFSIAAEKAVLSSILFNQEELLVALKYLKPKYFYLPMHQKIFASMISLYNKELPVDEEFIRKEIEAKRELVDNALIEILSANQITNIEAYCKTIKEVFTKKEIFNLSILLKKLSDDENVNSFEALSIVEDEIKSLGNRNMDDFLEAQPITEIVEEDTNYICKKFTPFPEYTVSLISAKGGIGKTWSTIRAADEIIKEDSNKKVLLVASEDRKGKIKARAKQLNFNNANFHVSDIMPFDALEKDFKTSRWKQTEEFFKFKNQVRKYDVVFIDPLISFYSGIENDNGDAKKFMVQFLNLAAKEKITIVFLHHTDKDGKSSRGAGAFADASRLTYKVTNELDSDGDIVEHSRNLRYEIQKENDDISTVKKLDKNRGFLVQVFPFKINSSKAISPNEKIEIKKKKIKASDNKKHTTPFDEIDNNVKKEKDNDTLDEFTKMMNDTGFID